MHGTCAIAKLVLVSSLARKDDMTAEVPVPPPPLLVQCTPPVLFNVRKHGKACKIETISLNSNGHFARRNQLSYYARGTACMGPCLRPPIH